MQLLDPMYYNLKLLIKDIPSLLGFSLVSAIVIWLGVAFVDIETTIGNLGMFHFAIDRVSHIILSLLIGVFVATHIFRFNHLKASSGKKTLRGAVGSFLGVLVTGCPSCSLTLAGLIGLAGVFSALPFSGLEVKIVGLLIMLRVAYRSVKDLLVCKVKSK